MFAAEKGYQFAYVALPVKRLFVEFSNGVGDFKYPDNPQWALHIKKDAPIVYSEPVVEYVNGVMVPPDAKGTGVDAISSCKAAWDIASSSRPISSPSFTIGASRAVWRPELASAAKSSASTSGLLRLITVPSSESTLA